MDVNLQLIMGLLILVSALIMAVSLGWVLIGRADERRARERIRWWYTENDSVPRS